MNRQILVTGAPGVGKTTVIRKVCDELLKDGVYKLNGFYTEEVRHPASGARIGFDVVQLNTGNRAPLATIQPPPRNAPKTPTVGKYFVMLEQFESIALQCFKPVEATPLLVLDELGKMESFSKPFCDAFLGWLGEENRGVLLATIPVTRGHPLLLVEKVKGLENSVVYTVTRHNREVCAPQIKTLLVELFSKGG